ncbi:MAG TPA: MoxR family ATPase [Candidatus Limnocylindria bacterium]|jgi:MoxR-like ATPase|nr:MoxR family ATPase [Candidatus Limnocylindria bacterium]
MEDRVEPRSIEGERFWRRLREVVGRAVVVDDLPLRLMAVALLANGHALVEDVPGVGKTLLTRAFSRALGLGFARVQGTPDLLPSDVLGASLLEGGSFRFVPGPIFTNVLLVDEINRATPRTQSALLESMEEGQATIEGETRPLPDPFLVLATQNPVELEGTFALPEAQLDRFAVRIRMGYPDQADERRIAGRFRASAQPLDAVEPIADAARLLALRDEVRQVTVSDEVADYLVGLVRASRERPELALGASPRASVVLYRIAQAWAHLAGRDFVLPDDVKAVAPSVLAHRVMLDVDRQLRGATAEAVVAELVAQAAAPPAGERSDSAEAGA